MRVGAISQSGKKQPLREIVAERINGLDVLSCGHEVKATRAGAHKYRRCPECPAELVTDVRTRTEKQKERIKEQDRERQKRRQKEIVTKRENTPSERFQIYMRGWRAGAGVKPIDPVAEGHPTLGLDYIKGYDEGIKVRREASVAAAARYGYTPSILRLAETNEQAEDVPSIRTYERRYACGHLHVRPEPAPTACVVCSTDPPEVRAKRRPLNYVLLSAEDQWNVDKELGLLDWKPTC